LDSLPEDQKFHQEYFIDELLQPIVQLRASYACWKVTPNLLAHMDNSMCHNGTKITKQFKKKRLIRFPHSSYSPDLNPCDFWAFGYLKHRLKDRQLQSANDIQTAIREA
jgi:hypothetical protein